MPDAKRKRAAGGESEEGDYVRLTPSLAKFMGGERYRKESELTLSRLLAYGRSKGRISECLQLVRVKVTTLDGKTATHTLDSEHHIPGPCVAEICHARDPLLRAQAVLWLPSRDPVPCRSGLVALASP